MNEAELEGHGVIIQMDGNLHAGPDLIKNDPNLQNKNGKLFMDFLKRNGSLIVLNSLNECEGLITRKRELKTSKTEEAVLDFFLINEKLRRYFKKMTIDEERNYCFRNISQIKKNSRIIESDHNTSIAEFDTTINK